MKYIRHVPPDVSRFPQAMGCRLFRQAKSDSYPYISPWHWTDGRSLPRRISVIIVCPTGIGSSRLLAENLHKAYPDLDIRGTTSAFHIEPEELAQNDIDLIISTVRLDTTYRYIYVSPLLNRQDRMLLDSKFQLILSQKSDRRPYAEKKVPETSFTRKDIHFISRTGAEIEYLLDHIRIGRAPGAPGASRDSCIRRITIF